MIFTKTQVKILEIFVSKITQKFSIREISKMLNKPYALIYRSIKPLIKDNFLIKDVKDLLSLNYKENLFFLSYIESIRKYKFLKKDKTLELFYKDVIEKLPLDFYILLVFGSIVEIKNPGDIDILLIIDKKNIEDYEKIIKNISSNFSKKFDINVISIESSYEMLGKQNNINVMNETLNKHIILFGIENYYKLLKNAR